MRFRFELHLDQRQIARRCSISVSTVHEYLKRAEATGIRWPQPVDWNDTQLQAALFPVTATPARRGMSRLNDIELGVLIGARLVGDYKVRPDAYYVRDFSLREVLGSACQDVLTSSS